MQEVKAAVDKKTVLENKNTWQRGERPSEQGGSPQIALESAHGLAVPTLSIQGAPSTRGTFPRVAILA